jgi:CHAT domain-containing protein
VKLGDIYADLGKPSEHSSSLDKVTNHSKLGMGLTKISFTVLSTLLATVWTPFSTNLSGSFATSRTLAQNDNVDQLANERNRVSVNPPTPITAVNNGLPFNGVDNYIEISDVPALNFGTGDFSISAWIKTNDKSGINVILDKRVEISEPEQGYVLFNSKGKLLLQLADGSGWTNYDSNVFIADGQWHHVGVTVDRDDLNGGRWYVNGQEVSKPFNPTGRKGSLSNSKPLRIGRRSDHPAWPGLFKNNLDKVKLFKRKLSAIEINAIYQADRVGTTVQVFEYPENCTGPFPHLRINLRINYNMGDYDLAIECYQQGLAIKWEIRNREMGSINFLLRHYPIEYQQSLAIAREIKYPQMEGAALGNLGNIYFGRGDYAKAIEYYQQSLAVAREIKSRLGEGTQLNNLGAALYKSGNFTAAEKTLIDAIKVWEYLRAKLGSNDVNKVSIFKEQARAYSALQEVLIAHDKPNDALEIAEQQRAWPFVELLAQRLSTNPNAISDINKPTIERIKQIAKAQNATLVEYSITGIYSGNSWGFERKKLFIWVIQPTGKVSFRQVDLGITNFLEELVYDTRVWNGLRIMGQEPQQLALSPGDLVKLKDDVPKWEPWEVITFEPKKRIVKLRQSSFPEGVTIERSVTDVANKVASRRTTDSRLQELHQLLIKPIADLLPTDPEARLIFIPHKDLFSVTFPALQDAEGKYLIEKHTILTAPAIQVLDLTRQLRSRVPGSAQKVLIVGNPTMPKVSFIPGELSEKLPALPYAELEAREIAQLFHTTALTGNQATKAAIVPRLSDSRLIHLATHGLFDGRPLNLLDNQRGFRSAIALAPSGTDNGFLTAEEVLKLNLNAELVVLSACNTGQALNRGDGIIDLSSSLIAAGVPSVIVAVWPVSDAPTAELMTEFYQNFQRTGDKAQALRQAMLTRMQQHPKPRDWAAFTLIGEAK